MTIEPFIQKLTTAPETVEFTDTMAAIEATYDYTPAAFNNGELLNEAGQNEGSCKLFAFAQLQGLSETQTLACFGQYYRNDVLQNPNGNDHQNIRNFMQTGWSGIRFDSQPLSPKQP